MTESERLLAKAEYESRVTRRQPTAAKAPQQITATMATVEQQDTVQVIAKGNTRDCASCGTPFVLPKNNPHAECCSRRCANNHWRAKKSREFPEHICVVCGTGFRPRHNGYKTLAVCCSRHCAGILSGRRARIRAGAKLGGERAKAAIAAGAKTRPRVDPDTPTPNMYVEFGQCKACLARGRDHNIVVRYRAPPHACVHCQRSRYELMKGEKS